MSFASAAWHVCSALRSRREAASARSEGKDGAVSQRSSRRRPGTRRLPTDGVVFTAAGFRNCCARRQPRRARSQNSGADNPIEQCHRHAEIFAAGTCCTALNPAAGALMKGAMPATWRHASCAARSTAIKPAPGLSSLRISTSSCRSSGWRGRPAVQSPLTADVGGHKLATTVGETILWSGDRAAPANAGSRSVPAAEKAPRRGAMLRPIDWRSRPLQDPLCESGRENQPGRARHHRHMRRRPSDEIAVSWIAAPSRYRRISMCAWREDAIARHSVGCRAAAQRVGRDIPPAGPLEQADMQDRAVIRPRARNKPAAIETGVRDDHRSSRSARHRHASRSAEGDLGELRGLAGRKRPFPASA